MTDLFSDFPPPPSGWNTPSNPPRPHNVPPIDYGVSDHMLNSRNSSGSTPAISFSSTGDPSKRLTHVTEDVVHQRQNISAALRLFDRLLPALGFDDKTSHARFGKLKQEKSNMEKELRKLKTIERMRVREGAKPSPILNEAKVLITEAIDKLDAAIDISEGEFKPLWLEVVRENQIIKSEQRAKDALSSATKMLNQQFSSGHIFLPGVFVQLVPEMPFPAQMRNNPHVRKILLSYVLPLIGTVVWSSFLLKYGIGKMLLSDVARVGSKLSYGRQQPGMLSRLLTSPALTKIKNNGALKILRNLDLFIVVRVVRGLVLGMYHFLAQRYGGQTAAETAQVLKTSVSLLKNLDVVILAHAALRMLFASVGASFDQNKPLAHLSNRIIRHSPISGKTAVKVLFNSSVLHNNNNNKKNLINNKARNDV
eukprot:jgi/Bigna1/132974/aug1.19_g7682